MNYTLERGPLIQEGEVHSMVIGLGKKRLFCGHATRQLVVIAPSAAPPASLAQQEAELLGCPEPCHAGEPQGNATTEESLQVGTNLLCLRAQVFQLDVRSAECSTFFTLVGLLKFCSPAVKVKWLCFLETMCLSFERE